MSVLILKRILTTPRIFNLSLFYKKFKNYSSHCEAHSHCYPYLKGSNCKPCRLVQFCYFNKDMYKLIRDQFDDTFSNFRNMSMLPIQLLLNRLTYHQFSFVDHHIVDLLQSLITTRYYQIIPFCLLSLKGTVLHRSVHKLIVLTCRPVDIYLTQIKC